MAKKLSIADRIAFNQGVKAAIQGNRVHMDNPYEEGSRRHEIWLDAFEHALGIRLRMETAVMSEYQNWAEGR